MIHNICYSTSYLYIHTLEYSVELAKCLDQMDLGGDEVAEMRVKTREHLIQASYTARLDQS